MSSISKAPTFKISNAASPSGGPAVVTLPADYDIIYSEWIDGWNGLAKDTDFTKRVVDSSNASGGTIYPHVVYTNKYSTVSKYNYADFSTEGSLTNNNQKLGSAFVFVKSSKDCAPSDDLTANVPVDCIDNGPVKKRWFGVSEATTGL